MTFDDIKYKEISDLVKNIELDWTDFDIIGIPCKLRTCPSTNLDGSANGQPAEYQKPEGAWVIYLWEDIGEKIQRPLLFHASVEIYHVEQGMKEIPAHNATMPWEKRFCEDYLNNFELENFLKFKKEHGYNEFDLSDNHKGSV